MSQDHLNKIIFTCESRLIKICVFYVDKVVIISKKNIIHVNGEILK